MANTSHLDHFCISAHPSSMINLDANTEVVLGIYFKISVYSHTAENELLKCRGSFTFQIQFFNLSKSQRGTSLCPVVVVALKLYFFLAATPSVASVCA